MSHHLKTVKLDAIRLLNSIACFLKDSSLIVNFIIPILHPLVSLITNDNTVKIKLYHNINLIFIKKKLCGWGILALINLSKY